jgi:hypothetical protein
VLRELYGLGYDTPSIVVEKQHPQQNPQ